MKHALAHIRTYGLRRTLASVGNSLMHGGVRSTFHRLRAHLDNQRLDPKAQYAGNQRSQEGYVRAYARAPLKARMRMLEDLLEAEKGYRGIVLYPTSYKLEMRQRPEHVLTTLAAEGYLCLMLVIGGDVPFVRRHGARIYATNLYEEALARFRHQRVVLYLTFPGHAYVARFLERAFLIYDVLDRLQIFAGYCPEMQRDHDALLARADLVTCSAPPLFDECAAVARECLLVPNGVFPEDFSSAKRPRTEASVTVGYYGAISELLDFDLLEDIADLPGVSLALAGPVDAFDPLHKIELQTRMDGLLARRKVKHHGRIEYEDLADFLGNVHCALVPFVVNRDTDAVSPLKLFEYMAAGKPVLATPTASVRQFHPTAFVGDRGAIVGRLRDGSWRDVDLGAMQRLVEQHSWPNLLEPVLARLGSTDLDVRSPADITVAESPRVDIININFFDWNGETVYKGGAERYVVDLARLCERLGCRVRVLQNANFAFERDFHGVQVVGVPCAQTVDFRVLSSRFAEVTLDADLVIASPLELACRFFPTRRVIGINHGIHWDARTTTGETFSLDTFRLVRESLQRTNHCVCVDTNFINWVRSFEWHLGQPLVYLPNYVDTTKFRAQPKDFDADELVVLYPRRLYDPRGFYETLDAFEFLLQSANSLNLHLCGQATGKDAERARRAVAASGGRVTWYERDMDDMPEAYAKSHIVLVPTMYAEGTSLSCIEAMATNNAVIATNVGGLPNLVQDGFNGLLIRPDTWSLVAALRTLAGDRALAARLAHNAIGVAESLSKARWEEKWSDLLGSLLQLPSLRRPAAAPGRREPVPAASARTGS